MCVGYNCRMAAIDPRKLTPAQLAELLSGAGAEITEEQIRRDVEEGAPVSGDGTMDLIHYAAWLAAQDHGSQPA